MISVQKTEWSTTQQMTSLDHAKYQEQEATRRGFCRRRTPWKWFYREDDGLWSCHSSVSSLLPNRYSNLSLEMKPRKRDSIPGALSDQVFFCNSAFKRQSSQIFLAFLKTATEESCTTSSQSLLAFVEIATEEPCTTSSQSLIVFLKTATEESCTTNRQILQENTANKPNAEFQTFTSSSLIHEEAGRENFCVQQPLAER